MMTSKTSAIATIRPGERDVVALDAARVALAVPALVVVADGVGPLAEPRPHRLDEALAVERVALELLPLVLVRAAGLVEDVDRHLQLADVVQQRRPVELVELGVGEPELGARSSPRSRGRAPSGRGSACRGRSARRRASAAAAPTPPASRRSRRACASASRSSSSLTRPESIAARKRDGAWSGKTSDSCSSAASGSNRRAAAVDQPHHQAAAGAQRQPPRDEPRRTSRPAP